MTDKQPQRIAIIGAGAAGMSCAHLLSHHPDKFKVTILERSPQCGGMATSVPLPSESTSRFGADYVNDGVQGGSPQFYNTYRLFEEVGEGRKEFESKKVEMQVSFGREAGEEGDYWSNVFPSDVIDKYAKDIAKFGKVLGIIGAMEPIFGLIPVDVMLKMFRFTPGFGETIVYPLVALFMGTGQQTPFVSAVILERLFTDPSMKLFEYDPSSFISSIPEMRAFPRLATVYDAWKTKLQKAGVDVLVQHEVIAVHRSAKEVKIKWQKIKDVNNDGVSEGVSEEKLEETFDEVVFCCDADTSLKLLGAGSGATWMEKKVLGNVKYLWDVSITHNDAAYMEKYYRVQYNSELASTKRQEDSKAKEQFDFASKNFKPLYFIRSYPSDKRKIEMSFDLTQYQGQFKENKDGSSKDIPELPDHVFQTIFLDQQDSAYLWTKDEINEDSIILEKWWKQMSHRWQHYGGTVPWMMWINGKNRTRFAGSWTILNMHEIAVCSGMVAAYQLGAEYPYNEDNDARRMFVLTLAANYGSRLRSKDRQGFLS